MPSAELTLAGSVRLPLVTTRKVGGPRSRKVAQILRIIPIYVLLLAGSVVFLYPLLWTLAASFRTNDQIDAAGMNIIPEQFRWANYTEALREFAFWRYLVNSIITTFIPIVGTVFSSAIVGFAFARIRTRGSQFLYYIVLATMLFPGQVILIPQFVLFKQLGMIDTLYPLIVGSIFASPFFIFMFRQFFARMPESLSEAAIVDGCGWFKMFTTIFLPLAKPVCYAAAVMMFMGNWNNFMGPQIYINSDRWKTLPMGLAGFTNVNGSDTSHLMAATVVVLLPCVVLFFFAQKLFLSGAGFAGTDR